ncbi:ras-related protein Rap-1b-like [Amphibalanus amphitrite]|uniref:ras-related protein Rap-1b-like n=1 Tax=Amphibalanus amphitrite TaxID=1232801 RepID=UPI001C90DA13|nr:ras-related protein Rap-1b-like [Amphibalanus amphitrite]
MPGREDGIKCLVDLICGSVALSADSGHHVRLLVLGGSRVGKTSICRRFLYGEFDERYRPTLEDQYSRSYHMGATRLRVDILDTCGDNSFPAMRRVSILHAQALMLVFSVDSYASFLQAIDCFTEVRRLRDDFRELPTLLVGNKSDMAGINRQVSHRSAASWFYSKMERNRGRFLECSALANTNVAEIFREYLRLGGIPLPAPPPPSNWRQLSLRLTRKRSESPPSTSSSSSPAHGPSPSISDQTSEDNEKVATKPNRSKPRSKSLVRRRSMKKRKSTEQKTDECGIQ